MLLEPQKAACEAKEKALAEHCPGELNEPKAVEGFLCLYEVSALATPNTSISFHGIPGGSGSGGMVGTVVALETTEASLEAEGSWAVTAP